MFFLPATVYDNQIVIDRDPGEVKRLQQLSKKDQKKFLFGNWDIYEGQFFDNWNPEVHIIQPEDYLSYEQIKEMNVLGGLDYGNVTVLVLGAKDYNNNVIIFDELYYEKEIRENKVAGLFKFLKERGLEKTTIIGDTNMWNPDAFDLARQEFPASYYLNAGIKLIKVAKKSPDNRQYRVACNEAIYSALDYKFDVETSQTLIKQPKIKIYKRCKWLIETLPALITDDKNVEDIADGQNDHTYDAMKYLYMALVKPKEKKPEDIPKWLQEMQKQEQKKVNNDFMSV